MNNISAVIVVKNSPPHVLETIRSITELVEEIIIVDIGVEEKLAHKLGAIPQVKIITVNEEIPFVELIREKSKTFAKNEYVLFLDPDEVISPELKKKLNDEYLNYDYISMPRKNIIFGSWIQHARWWPDYQIRLFKKHAVTWEPILHAQPKVKGKGLEIEPHEQYALIHYNYEDLNEFFTKMNRYAQSEAKTYYNEKTPVHLHTTIKKALSEFISRYFADQGYKDGLRGFILSFMQMFYYFMVFFYYSEKHNFENEKSEKLINSSYTFFRQGLYETTFWIQKNKLLNLPHKIKSKILTYLLKD